MTLSMCIIYVRPSSGGAEMCFSGHTQPVERLPILHSSYVFFILSIVCNRDSCMNSLPGDSAFLHINIEAGQAGVCDS